MRHPPPIALVTGASKGVGKGIAIGLAAAGWDVIVPAGQTATLRRKP
jgi:NAD(P)-dependent dehydrogenase (short-subunit alcohol dehydrogenase family)